MGICAAANCSNKRNKAKNIVLYHLPKDKTYKNAFEHYGKCQKFEQELNTKSTQTTKEVETSSAQTIAATKRDVGTKQLRQNFLANIDNVEE